jgi:Putative zinc-finger
MIDHARIRELLAAPPVFALSPAEQAEVDSHLAGCDACRAFADGLSRDTAALQALPRTDAPDSVRRAVLGRARRRHSAGWYPAAAAAVVVIFVAPLAIAAVFLGGLHIGGLDFIFGGSGAAAPTAVPGTKAPGVEPTGGPPAEPPSVWRPVALVLGDARQPTSLGGIAVGRSSIVAVGTSCEPGGRTCFASVALSMDGTSWELVQSDSELEVEPLADGAIPGMRDVVAGGPGFVAVGATGSGSRSSGAVWTSGDGTAWLRAPDADVFRDGWINSIVALDDGTLIAGGGRLVEGSVQATAWTSIDGQTWQRRDDGPDLDAGFGPVALGRESPGIHDLVVDPDIGLVAVGLVCDPLNDSCRGAAWGSADGSTWTRTTDADSFGGGQPRVAVASGGLLTAAGTASGAPAIWMTKDARRWLPSEIEDARPGGFLLALTEIADRQWAAGTGDAGQAGVWSSELGDTWRLTRSADLEGATIRALETAGDVVVAAGERDGQGALWIAGREGDGP